MSESLAITSDYTEKHHERDLCLRTFYATLLFGLCVLARTIIFVYQVYTGLLGFIGTDYYFEIIALASVLGALSSSLNYFVFYGVYGKVVNPTGVEPGEPEESMNLNITKETANI